MQIFYLLYEFRMREATHEKNGNVCHSQAEEEKVRRRPHAFRPEFVLLIFL